MKNILYFSAFALLMILSSCEKEDTFNVDQIKQGAVLTTISAEDLVINLFDPVNSNATIEVKFDDFDDNDTMDKVNLYVSFRDASPTDTGVFETSADEALLTTLAASEFTTASDGYPHNTFVMNGQAALDALGLSIEDIDGGDVVFLRYELILDDGSRYSSDNVGVSGAVAGAGHHSPFKYASIIACIPTSAITGDYIVDMHDSYGDGWQGSAIVVTIDGVSTSYSLGNYWAGDEGPYVDNTITINVPNGSTTLDWSFVAGNYPSEVSFEITGPNSGNIIGEFGPSPMEGPLTLNYCNE
jgi:hypothetical protein